MWAFNVIRGDQPFLFKAFLFSIITGNMINIDVLIRDKSDNSSTEGRHCIKCRWFFKRENLDRLPPNDDEPQKKDAAWGRADDISFLRTKTGLFGKVVWITPVEQKEAKRLHLKPFILCAFVYFFSSSHFIIWFIYMMTSSNRTFSALLALCVGNSPVTGEFP